MRSRGFTIIELAVAVVIVGLLAVGSLGYQYYANRDARRAEAQMTAARLAKTVLDQWRGSGGTVFFNPPEALAPHLILVSSQNGPAPASDGAVTFNILGRYRTQIKGNFYFITCSWLAGTVDTPRLLNVAVGWRPDYADGPLGSDAKEVRYSLYCGL